MKRAKGFTLIEVMVVVVIVAILVSVVLPSYSDYVKKGKIAEATSNLSALRVSMEQYYQDNRTYANAGVCGIGAAPNATSFFTYACSNATATTYLITATGQASMTGFTYTIDQANSKWTTVVPAGWGTAPINCWVTKQAGLC